MCVDIYTSSFAYMNLLYTNNPIQFIYKAPDHNKALWSAAMAQCWFKSRTQLNQAVDLAQLGQLSRFVPLRS